jgi:hypothetical protein
MLITPGQSPAKEASMNFGHNFKYRIPEMDLLLGAAADVGIQFTSSNETEHDHEEKGKFIVQLVTVKIGETVILIDVNSMNPEQRVVTKA